MWGFKKMVKQRENTFVRIIQEPALSRIKNNQCPVCGKPKSEWNRRTDWRCCSPKCTEKFEDFCIIRDWSKLRQKCFERDNYTCVKCGLQPKHTKDSWRKEGTIKDGELVADHIIPIALGGEQWDINNLQTLCIKCNKIKTKEDAKNIAKLRRIEKKLSNGQKQLVEVSANSSHS